MEEIVNILVFMMVWAIVLLVLEWLTNIKSDTVLNIGALTALLLSSLFITFVICKFIPDLL